MFQNMVEVSMPKDTAKARFVNKQFDKIVKNHSDDSKYCQEDARIDTVTITSALMNKTKWCNGFTL